MYTSFKKKNTGHVSFNHEGYIYSYSRITIIFFGPSRIKPQHSELVIFGAHRSFGGLKDGTFIDVSLASYFHFLSSIEESSEVM